MAVRFLIYFNYLVEYGGFCQGILIQELFWGRFLRKIGGFTILEIVVNPERDRRAVSPEQCRLGKEAPGFDQNLVSIYHVYQRICGWSKFVDACQKPIIHENCMIQTVIKCFWRYPRLEDHNFIRNLGEMAVYLSRSKVWQLDFI